MKKIFAVLVAMALALSLSCALAENGKLTVAVSPDFAPMEFVDTSKSGQDQFIGFDISLAKFLAAELGLELEIKPMSFDACQTAVETGAVDMSISGYSKTDKRAENFELSDFYYAGDNETQQSIIVKAENAGKWTTAEDFANLTVAAQDASLQYDLCLTQLPETVSIKLFKTIDDAVLSLMTGKVDAVAVAHGNGDAIIANNDQIAFSGFDFEVEEEQSNNVILIQKGNTELLEKVNAALAKAYEAGYYPTWYAEAKELAGIPTAADVSFDAEGAVVTDDAA